MPATRRDDPRAKIQRAKQHIVDLGCAVESYFAEYPCRVIDEMDGRTGQQRHRVEGIAEVPADISSIAGDAIHNLRSALDHLLFRIFPDKEKWTRQNGFPVAANAGEYKDRSPKKLKGLPSSLVERIDKIRPYKGGNDSIWRLHELNNIDKHRALLTIATAADRQWIETQSSHFAARYFAPSYFGRYFGNITRPGSSINPVDDGAILGPISDGPRVITNDSVVIVVVLNETVITTKLEPIVPLLEHFTGCIEEVVGRFDDII